MPIKVYLARAMDEIPPTQILTNDEEYLKRLKPINCVITNPYETKQLDAVTDGYSISQGDIEQLKKSDLLLADLSIRDYQYVGCIFEIVHASIENIPVILVVGNNDNYAKRIYFQAYCDFIALNSDEAVEYIRRAFTAEGVEEQMIEMQSYYNDVAHTYHSKSHRKYRPKSDESILQKQTERKFLYSILNKYSRGKVCQIGIGTGDWTLPLCKTAEMVYGIEVSSEMLKEAKNYLSSFNNIRYFESDVLKDDISGGSFDCIVLYFFLSILPRAMQDHIFNKINKLLKPDGFLIVADTKELGGFPAFGLGRKVIQTRIGHDKE